MGVTAARKNEAGGTGGTDARTLPTLRQTWRWDEAGRHVRVGRGACPACTRTRASADVRRMQLAGSPWPLAELTVLTSRRRLPTPRHVHHCRESRTSHVRSGSCGAARRGGCAEPAHLGLLRGPAVGPRGPARRCPRAVPVVSDRKIPLAAQRRCAPVTTSAPPASAPGGCSPRTRPPPPGPAACGRMLHKHGAAVTPPRQPGFLSPLPHCPSFPPPTPPAVLPPPPKHNGSLRWRLLHLACCQARLAP